MKTLEWTTEHHNATVTTCPGWAIVCDSRVIASGIAKAEAEEIARQHNESIANATAAMEILKNCYDNIHLTIAISKGTTGWWISDCDKKSRYAIGETLELAICLFAKKLFAELKTP